MKIGENDSAHQLSKMFFLFLNNLFYIIVWNVLYAEGMRLNLLQRLNTLFVEAELAKAKNLAQYDRPIVLVSESVDGVLVV